MTRLAIANRAIPGASSLAPDLTSRTRTDPPVPTGVVGIRGEDADVVAVPRAGGLSVQDRK
jgi:hypothetical protein